MGRRSRNLKPDERIAGLKVFERSGKYKKVKRKLVGGKSFLRASK